MTPPEITPSEEKPTTSGWLAFGGLLVLVAGLSDIFVACAALWKSNYFIGTSHDLLIFNFTAWGWIWMIVGIVLVVTGLGVLWGAWWARITGVFFALLSLLGHLLYLSAHPLWSLISVGLSLLVVYALTVPDRRATGV
ncbi:DUF7144 family membrane protein [Streptomyces xiaopingdaonensis]|uniref:DUF7144 family membrane protein n=1 Tax=Streptomyces xiaopingdaonensis TaxID=1565415 RepID=UPI0002F0FFDC|nr:hypothetical protein [Streptomyces xiaopingdaonensis]